MNAGSYLPKWAVAFGLVTGIAVPLASHAQPQPFDLVFRGARAIDPETGLDAVRDVGIQDGKIAAIATEQLKGRKIIDARGLVIAPGFIDLHSHAYSYDTATYQAMDGVTTRLELELGVFPVKRWYESKDGRELINYGASVSHNRVRYALQLGGSTTDPKLHGFTDDDLVAEPRFETLIQQPIPTEVYDRFTRTLEEGLNEGALGIGSGTQYAPGITHREMLDLTALAARRGTCVYTHIRYGSLVEPQSTLEALQEQIANAAITGACVHIVHLNSMAMSSTPQMIELFRGARARGADLSTEIYPWDASFDQIRSIIFDPGWEARWGVSVSDLQSRADGQRLTQARFDALRSGTADDGVLMHMNTEATITTALRDPLVIVASDSVDIADRYSHPRSAGTFCRVLGHYVRETKALSLAEAIRKISLMPAQRLEAFAPAMKKKGRLQVGADADLVVFDPETVSERARYLDAKQYSTGMRYVLVNGQFVVRSGQLVKRVFPGQPIYSTKLQ